MNQQPSYIYLVKNLINGKLYVGRTKHKVTRRWKQHVNCAHKKCNTYLGRAIIRHGAAAFAVSVLETTSVDLAPSAELKWIEKLNATNRKIGYNLTDKECGSSGRVGLPTRRKLSQVSRAYWAAIPSDVRSDMISRRLAGLPKSNAHRVSIRKARAGKSSAHTKTSAFVGVRRTGNVWEANCYHEGRCYGRVCATEVEAAVAYDMFSIALRGADAPLNFEERRDTYDAGACRQFLQPRGRSGRYKYVSLHAQSRRWCVFIGGVYRGIRTTETAAADLAASIVGASSRAALLRPCRRSVARPPLAAV